MTTTVKVLSHNAPAKVVIMDQDPYGQNETFRVDEERILKPEDGEVSFYCTTSRKLTIQDIEV